MQYYFLFSSAGSQLAIFVDKKNAGNFWIIKGGPYIELNKNIAAQFIAMQEQQLQEIQEQKGISWKRLKKKFFQTGKSKIIMSKYLQEFNGQQRTTTQYIISSEYQTFGFVIVNATGEDYAEVIKRI